MDPSRAYEHVRSDHPQCCTVSRNLSSQLKEAYPKLLSTKVRPTARSIPAVYGLAIPLEKYVICGQCLHGFKTAASLQAHECEGGFDLEGEPFSSHVQTFFHGSRCCYLPITTPREHPLSLDQSDYQAFVEQQKAQPSVESEVCEPDDYRQLQQFLYREGWTAHLMDVSPDETSDLIAAPRVDECIGTIPAHVLSLMTRLQSMLMAAGFQVRRLVGKRPS